MTSLSRLVSFKDSMQRLPFVPSVRLDAGSVLNERPARKVSIMCCKG